MRRSARGGFSLLEVVLATSILLAVAIVLFELAAIGRAHIESAEDLTTAQRICQTRINEILSGASPLQVVQGEPLEEDSDWTITVALDPVEQMPGLAALRVTVSREASPGHRAKQYTLVRWIRDSQAGHEGETPLVPASSPLEGPAAEALP